MRIEFRRLERWLGGIGLLGVLGALALVIAWPRAALTGWLGAAVLIQAIPAGALMLLMMMRLIGGDWEDELRVVCEAGALLLPLAALAFLPVLIGMGVIYDWPVEPAASAFQAGYLGYIPFALRTVLWFLALAVAVWSQVGRRAAEGESSVGLIVLVLLGSFVAVDWLMSLDPQFASSGFGLQLISIEICVAYTAVLLLRLTVGPPPGRPAVLGGLLLTLLLLWAYFQFMPYFIIWSGNLPEGVAWYRERSGGAWNAVLWAIALLGGIPLLALLFPRPRRDTRWLAILSAIVLVGKAVELAWFAIPGRGGAAVLGFLLGLLGLGALAAAGLLIAIRSRAERKQAA